MTNRQDSFNDNDRIKALPSNGVFKTEIVEFNGCCHQTSIMYKIIYKPGIS